MKKLYTLLCGAAVVALAGAAIVENGTVTNDPVQQVKNWTADAPTITATSTGSDVAGVVTTSYQGFYNGNLTPQNLPANFMQDVTVYRTETRSYDEPAAVVYTKQNVGVAEEVNFTETDLANGTYYYYAVAANHANPERVSEPSDFVEVKVANLPAQLYVVGTFNNWSMTEGYITLNYDEETGYYAGSSEGEDDEFAQLQGNADGLGFMVYDQLENPNFHYGPSADAFGPVDCTFDTTEQMAMYQGSIAAESFGYWQFPDVKAAPYFLGFYVSLDEEDPYIVCQAALAPETPEPANALYVVGSFNDWSLTEGYITLAWDEDQEMYVGASQDDEGELMELKGCESGLAFRVMTSLEEGATMYGPVGGSFLSPAVDCTFEKGDMMSEYIGLLEENAKYWQFPDVKAAPYFLGFYVSLEGDEPAIMVQAALQPETPPTELPEELRIIGPWNNWSYEQSTMILHRYADEEEEGLDPGQYIAEIVEFPEVEDGLIFRFADANGVQYGATSDDSEGVMADEDGIYEGELVVGTYDSWWFFLQDKAVAATVVVDLANNRMGVMFADAPGEGEVIPAAPEFTAEYDATAKAVNTTVTLPTKGEYTENWSTFEEVDLAEDAITKVEIVRTSGFEFDYVKTWTAEDGLTPGATLSYADANVVAGKTYKYYAIVAVGENTAQSEQVTIEIPTPVVVMPVENLAVAYTDDAQNELKATWTNNAEVNVANIKGYNVYINDVKANEALVEAEEYTFSIAENTLPQYGVRVETVFSNEETASASTTFTVYTPAAATGVKAETNATLNGVNISWTAPEVGNPIGIKGYNVFVNGAKVNDTLIEGTAYEYAFPEGAVHGENWQVAVETVFANEEAIMSDAITYSVDTSVAMILANDANAKVYNLQGVEVKNPTNGVFVVVSNGKTFKVTIKK